MIIVDSSALIAIALFEPDRRAYQDALAATDAAYISAINYVETGTILVRRKLIATASRFDLWLATFRVELREDVALGDPALDAYARYGKGHHPARLNLGDCFAYALAKQLDLPLLYKGDDFAQTDIRSAL